MRLLNAESSRNLLNRCSEIGKVVGSALCLSGLTMILESRMNGLALPADPRIGIGCLVTGTVAYLSGITIEAVQNQNEAPDEG